MSLRRAVWLMGGVLLVFATLHAQRAFRTYIPLEGADSDAPLPPDYKQNADFVLGRLMYPSAGRGFGGSWLHGGTNWTIDYPKGDRFFASALRRLTRVEVRSVEQPVNPDDDDDIFNWPYMHVAMPSTWNLTEAQAKKIRDYLLRGGFMICDSFFGDVEWEGFEAGGLQRIFPDRTVEELPDEDPIFQTVYDLQKRYQVGNYRSMRGRGVPYRGNGAIPHWRTIRDDKGRAMFAINFNNDLGDSWQLADIPDYPAKDSDLGIRLGVNYVTYALTH